MTRNRAIGGVVFVVAAGAIGIVIAASSPDVAESKPEPVLVEPIAGSDLKRVTLTQSAADRLDIQTDVVTTSNPDELVVPSAALIITPDGRFWVYASSEPLVYQRWELGDATERDFRVYYQDGPPEGTEVVITGVPELYGAEFGIGK